MPIVCTLTVSSRQQSSAVSVCWSDAHWCINCINRINWISSISSISCSLQREHAALARLPNAQAAAVLFRSHSHHTTATTFPSPSPHMLLGQLLQTYQTLAFSRTVNQEQQENDQNSRKIRVDPQQQSVAPPNAPPAATAAANAANAPPARRQHHAHQLQRPLPLRHQPSGAMCAP